MSSSYRYNIPSGFFAIPTSSAPLPPPPPPPPPPPLAGTTAYNFNYNYNASPCLHNSKNTKKNWTRGNNMRFKNQSSARPQPMQCSNSSSSSNNTSWSVVKQYRCNACNLNLESATAFETHIKTTHVKCNHCDFMAAPHVVQGHEQVEHRQTQQIHGGGFKTITVAISGCPVQRFRICVGNRTEDVQLWIAERRKRFPKSSNNTASSAATTTQVQNNQRPKTEQKADGGLSALLAGYSSSSSSCDDNDSDNDSEENASRKRKATLMEKLDERDQEESGDRTEHQVEDQQMHQVKCARVSATHQICRYFSKNGTCRNGDHCRSRHEHGPIHIHTDHSTRAKTNQHHQAFAMNSNSSSLLGKLLANDVKREAILTLQILDFIFESKFLENVPSSQSADRNCSTNSK